MKKLIKSSFIKYCFFGSLGGALEIGTFYLFANILNVHYIYSNAIAFTISVIFLYFANSRIVFNISGLSKKEKRKQFIIFFITRILGLLLDTSVLAICISGIGLTNMIAKLISCASTTIINYYIGKLFVFKD